MTRFKTQFDKRPVKDGHFPCDDFREGDGQDPRYDSDGPRRVANRKALQLCAQVADALNLALPECHDDRLRELLVESVISAPDSSQLLVTIKLPSSLREHEVMECLHNAVGKLRSDVASFIHRKRVPHLKFQLKI